MTTVNGLDALTRAAIKSGSDKYGGHLYTPVYHELFAPRREAPLRMLEIGVGGYDVEQAGGLSLKMWADYFPNATIVGLDIHKKSLDFPSRIQVVQGSQTDTELLSRLNAEYGPFDIVVDDGSHMVEHQLISFRALYPLIATDGIYAIEDTQTSFKAEYGGQPDGSASVFEMAYKVGLLMHRREGFEAPGSDQFLLETSDATRNVAVYRNIIAFQRGPNTYPSNFGLDLANPEVTAVLDQIAAQEQRDPSPTAVLSRIDMMIWGGRGDQAAALALQAAEAHPRERSLLFSLARMMAWAGQEHALQHVRNLLSQLD